MADDSRFTIGARIESFRYAFRGLRTLLASQHNAWIHAVATLCACALGFALEISLLEWCAVVLAIAVVWTAEGLNTAVELVCDAAEPEFHPLVEKAKDVAAASVLIAAFGALVIGLVVFGPRLARLLG
jgi:diacylglycerol kinase (ATP)